jgi:Kef-type K+ transport system membrane component KefB
MATTGNYSRVPVTIIGAAILVVVLLVVIRPLLRRTAVKVHSNEDLTPGALAVVVVLLMASALVTDHLGLYSVFGGFIMGVALPRNAGYVKAVIAKLKDITVVLLLPCFFTFSGLNTNILVLGEINLWVPALAIVLFAFAAKYISVTLSMRFFSRFSWRESSAIGGLINSRGLMDLIIANIGLQTGLIGPGLFAIIVLIAVTTTLAALPIYNLSMGKGKPPS